MSAGKKAYDGLTVEEKADFIAGLINGGLYNYFDNCRKEGADRYVHTPAEGEYAGIGLVYTAAELVKEAEGYDKQEIMQQWEDRNND